MNRFRVMLFVAALSVPCPDALAQEIDLGRERGPRFLLASAERNGRTVRLDVSKTPVLREQLMLALENVPLKAALATLVEQSGVDLVYSDDVLPSAARVTLHARGIAVAAALTHILLDARVDVVFLRSGTVTLSKQPAPVLAGTISGRVTEAATGNPVPQAQVTVAGTSLARATGEDGRYMIAGVPPGQRTVTVRRLGYEPMSREASVVDGEVVTADFSLLASATRLTEIMTTVTGGQRRVELGHTVDHIRADSINDEAPIVRFSDLLGARVAGLQIISNNGFTGESPRIRIRGIGSISRSRDPLIYVDGIRVESSTASAFNPIEGSLAYGQLSGRLNDFNPEEIESVEVVKGPSAATLYGTDAANGVIVIRTKHGRPGPARWNTYFEAGKLEPGNSFRAVDTYFSWGTNTSTGREQRCLITQLAAGQCRQDSLTVFNPLTNAETTPITTGSRSQVGVQVGGGAGEFTYFLSGDREEETGWLRMPSREVDRLRTERGGAEIPEWQLTPNALNRVRLRAGFGTTIANNADVQISSGFVSSDIRIPNNSIFLAGYQGPGFRDASDGWAARAGRPAELFAIKSAEEVTRYTGGVTVNWRPLGWLSTRATIGTDVSGSYYDGIQRPGEGVAAGRTGRRLNSRTTVEQHTADVGVSAVQNISPTLTSRTSVGGQYNRRNQLLTLTSATDLPPGAESVTGAATITGGEQGIQTVVAGAYVEEMFGLNDRIFLTGAVRIDGGSSFGQNFNTAAYPKVSASWLVSEEPFLSRFAATNDLRLRLAYGHAGVQPGSTDALALMSRFTSVIDGTPTSGAALGTLGNPRLKPERQREVEGGFDLTLFEGRIEVDATYYNRLSLDALVAAPLASSVGLGSRWENLGSIRNSGYEGMLAVQLAKSKPVGLTTTLNASLNRNRLEKLGIAGITSIGTSTSHHREGFPTFGRWGRPILGFSDANGNHIIEASEVQVGDSLAYLGPSHPPRQLTSATVLSLFDDQVHVSSQFDYRGGHRAINFTLLGTCVFRNLSCREVNDPSAPLDAQARAVVATVYGTPGWTGYMEDASFLRWRELAITYRVPPKFTRHVGASELNITLSGRNLRLWTDYTGVDPEVNSSPGFEATEGNGDNPTAPQTRYWLIRIGARF